MSEAYVGDDIEKILGQEFLTWLWFKSETNPVFTTEDKEFILFTERRVVVEYGDGQSVEIASASGALSELKEARLGMSEGKKVVRATYKIEQAGEAYLVTLKATDFSMNGFRTPKLDKSDIMEDEEDAFFLEKMFLIEQGIEFINTLFSQYVHLRCSALWQEESSSIRKWIADSLA